MSRYVAGSKLPPVALPWLWALLSGCSCKSCSALPIGVRAAGLLPKGLLRGEYGNAQLLARLTFSLSLVFIKQT